MYEKLISEFKLLGCKSDKEAAVAAQVYLELSEVKRYWEVLYSYDAVTESIYLTAKQTKSSKANIYIPLYSSQHLSFNILQKYLHLAKTDSSVILCFLEADSTCVYYQCTDGLNDTIQSSSKEGIEDKRERLDSNIRKLRPLIEDSALCGTALPAVIYKSYKKQSK